MLHTLDAMNRAVQFVARRHKSRRVKLLQEQASLPVRDASRARPILGRIRPQLFESWAISLFPAGIGWDKKKLGLVLSCVNWSKYLSISVGGLPT
jgi:hypothetical protein